MNFSFRKHPKILDDTSLGSEVVELPNSSPYLSLRKLTKRYGKISVVKEVSLDVVRGEFVCVLGPSGCGKTTLLRLIAGFEAADAGSISQAGEEISALPPEARDFGIVFQSYALFPNRTVAGNIGFGLECQSMSGVDKAARIKELLALVALCDHTDKYPSQLSGGQQQRVALARALALSPSLLLLDEPLSALDANVRSNLRDELRLLQRRVGVTTLMVTHDQQEALSIADRVVVMNAGRIEQVGTPAELYHHPVNLFVARFLGEVNALPVSHVSGNKVETCGLSFHFSHALQKNEHRDFLCFRPSAVSIESQSLRSPQAINATVIATAFLGDRLRLKLEPESKAMTPILAETPYSRDGTPPQLGEKVAFTVAPSQLFMLNDHG